MKENGRPSIYTKELADTICLRISRGESVRSIGEDPEMPAATTIHQWVLDDKEGFSKQYARAKSIGAEQAVDEMELIARTEDDVQRAKLIIDTRKWALSKQIPKKYGDKLDMTTDGEPINFFLHPSLAEKNNVKGRSPDTETD